MRQPVIVSAVRTAQAKFAGALKDIKATELGSKVIKGAINTIDLDPKEIEEVIMGNVVSAGQGQNVARQAAIGAGLPYNVGAFHVDKVCGSSLKAVVLAAQAIKCGDADTILAGGMESMSNCPYILDKARFGYRLFDGKITDSMVKDGLWDVYNDFHMGHTGEIIAEKYSLTREEIDEFAVWSHQKAAKATENGHFKDEVIPVEVPQRKKEPVIFDKDEGIRYDASLEGMARLKPFFRKDGVVTAGNSSQLTDGASATIIMSEEKANELGLDIMGRITGYNTSGVEPSLVMEAVVPGVRDLLKKMDLTIDDIDIVEHNEAFSSASVALMKAHGIPKEKFNVNGGAVALGHPIGSSGSRILTTLLHAMKRLGKKRGLATICLGGGNAVNMVVEK
ncbi:MAG: thiolase family protein [Candidatus Thermoplasmatota archaeon]|nr:thiolase family protein [Candidatus Thermoplasmatota archaeon]